LLAFLILFSTATFVPLGYLFITYSTLIGELGTEAEINAWLITTIVNDNPALWRFEQPRIEEYLSRRSRNLDPEARRVFDLNNVQVAAVTDAPRPPIITRSAQLFDAGVVVGRIDVSRSAGSRNSGRIDSRNSGLFKEGQNGGRVRQGNTA
jgi:hypothetical protein